MLAWLSFAVLGALALLGGHAAGRRWRHAAAWEWAVFPQPGYAGTQSVQL
jgi:hypothetical protein